MKCLPAALWQGAGPHHVAVQHQGFGVERAVTGPVPLAPNGPLWRDSDALGQLHLCFSWPAPAFGTSTAKQ